MKKIAIMICFTILFAYTVSAECCCTTKPGYAGDCSWWDGSFGGCVTRDQCLGSSGGGVPEFSTVGITAIIALAAGGAIGFNIGKKKK